MGPKLSERMLQYFIKEFKLMILTRLNNDSKTSAPMMFCSAAVHIFQVIVGQFPLCITPTHTVFKVIIQVFFWMKTEVFRSTNWRSEHTIS